MDSHCNVFREGIHSASAQGLPNVKEYEYRVSSEGCMPP